MTSKHLVAASSEPILLALLSREESYGYAIIQAVKRLSGGTLEWTDGMLYPVLHRLERRGLIESRWDRSPEGRRRRYYMATEAGRKAVAESRRDWRAVTDALEALWGPAAEGGALGAA